MNLYVNAVEKMQEWWILRIKSELHDINSFDAKKTWITSWEYIVIKLSDTWGGIDGALQNHIFEPFFTTKKWGKGYWLGLSAAYGIIHSHKWIINVKNIETGTEKGAEFTILFPRWEKVTKKIETASWVMQEGSWTVLVVDDDDVLRELVSEVLDQLWYQHFSAIDGQEWVDIYREFNHEIDLVLLDMQMPRMWGKEAFKLMKSINENVIAILCSWFWKNDEAQEILDLGAKWFLEKPFTIWQLSQLIKSTITVKK
jgi:CheY-like chemotaxis protein